MGCLKEYNRYDLDNSYACYLLTPTCCEISCSDPDTSMGNSIAVSCIGRQPDSDVYVVGPKLQFNMKGEPIAEEDQHHVWVEEILTALGMNRMEILDIPTNYEGELSPMIRLWETLQAAIGEGNLYSGIMLIGILLKYINSIIDCIFGIVNSCTWGGIPL